MSGRMERVAIIGNPENRRIALFQAALARQGWPPAKVVSYVSLLRGEWDEALESLSNATLLRLESPGEHEEVERRLVTDGLELTLQRPAVVRMAADGLIEYQHGEVLPNAAWYVGYRQLLKRIAAVVEQVAPQARWMNAPGDVLHWFDKLAVTRQLAEQGVPVPAALGLVWGYDDLRALLHDTNTSRVFVKLRYSSSASGVIAFQIARKHCLAVTSLEMVEDAGRLHLFNSLRVRRYDDEPTIARLIDALSWNGLHVERWVPKASWQGHAMDLRVVVIAGQPRHTVVRMSRGPLTNLHLGNRRGDLEALQRTVPQEAWQAMHASLAQATALYPTSHYVGADVLFTPGFTRHAIVELNAFGDLLPGVLHEEHDTYEAEVVAWPRY
jgi:hypothetical protein